MVRVGLAKKREGITLSNVEAALSFSQPRLSCSELKESVFCEGEWAVSDGPNPYGPIATYEVQILFFKNFPSLEPAVFEVGGKLERVANRHMYTNGRCCTCVWEEWLATAPDTSVQGFCSGPLHNFFLSQVIFDQKEKWPFGQRSHGLEGVLEAARALLSLDCDNEHVEGYLRIAAAKSIRGHTLCPCGSGRRLRDCHFEELKVLRATSQQELACRLLDRLRKTKRDEKAN